MRSSSGSAKNQTPMDWTLLNDLYETIETNPPAIEARELLLQQWIQAGDPVASKGAAEDLLTVDPSNKLARKHLGIGVKGKANRSSAKTPPTPVELPVRKATNKPSPKTKPAHRSDPRLLATEDELVKGHEALRKVAQELFFDIRLIDDLREKKGYGQVDRAVKVKLKNLQALSGGQISAMLAPSPPGSVLSVSRAMEADPQKALDIAVDDLGQVIRWKRAEEESSDEALREALSKRIRVLDSVLPEDLRHFAGAALVHAEHEELHRTYVNDETMLMESIADIPRDRFWVSEDGYAWDMAELADCLKANSGVMRNYLSREMFTADDVRAIVQHPLGKRLAALQLEQSQLSQGVRQATIDRLENLSASLLADMSDDQMRSRRAIDEYLSYVAMLPSSEQRALDELKVPAVDSHTGQAFDCTIGEAVRDAQANRVCIHKTGDFLKTSARYLRGRRG